MAVPAVSTLLRFEPSTFYRFVCGLVSVVAVIGFLPGVHTGTPLEVLDHVADWWAGSSSWTWPLRAHHWIANRSTQLGPIASVAMIVGVFAARGNDRSPDSGGGSSTALAGWALAVEADAGGSGLGCRHRDLPAVRGADPARRTARRHSLRAVHRRAVRRAPADLDDLPAVAR